FFFFSSRRRHTRFDCDWSSDVCSSDLLDPQPLAQALERWIERVEARNPRREAAVVVARAGALLDPRKVEEAFGQLVACRPLAARSEERRVGKEGRAREWPDQ